MLELWSRTMVEKETERSHWQKMSRTRTSQDRRRWRRLTGPIFHFELKGLRHTTKISHIRHIPPHSSPSPQPRRVTSSLRLRSQQTRSQGGDARGAFAPPPPPPTQAPKVRVLARPRRPIFRVQSVKVKDTR